MENEAEVPQYVLNQLEMIGILPGNLVKTDIKDEPKIPRNFEFNMPELDENGEPPF